MSGGTRVEQGALKQAADSLVGLRADSDRVDNKPIEKTVTAAQGLNKSSGPGETWESADALIAMGERFSDSVSNLKKMLGDISANIHETHKGYTKAEEQEKAKYGHGANQSMYDDFG
ncbi:hypothetical protein HCC61_15885 [Streptomyces sp. HNM0575]|uniref:hypothetical protein n=1 Tax=Streptomyces sp. HNM0575 TaxID=2716338 RepID=UPI00145DAEE3|nr:hypothetical protein [Streptomyces sp. HNM0575]NLU74144.1 hypothetical protein [Streptomyces sp. HNM0575]